MSEKKRRAAMKKKKSDPFVMKNYIKTVQEIECHFCGIMEDSAALAAYFVFNLHGWGWREVTSKKYQVVAAACPVCAKKKDKDR